MRVAIHNKNGKGLLRDWGLGIGDWGLGIGVAIHNKNGKGLLPFPTLSAIANLTMSQSTIKGLLLYHSKPAYENGWVAIHNKNGKGLLHNYE